MRHDNDRDSHGNATDWISCRTSAMFRRRIVSKICFFSCCDNTARLFNWTTLVSAACAKRGHAHATCPTVSHPRANHGQAKELPGPLHCLRQRLHRLARQRLGAERRLRTTLALHGGPGKRTRTVPRVINRTSSSGGSLSTANNSAVQEKTMAPPYRFH